MSGTIDHIGKIIYHYMAIETFINNLLKLNSGDTILTNEIVKTSLHKKADILEKILERECKDLTTQFIKKLIADIKKLDDEKKIINYNSLLSKEEDLNNTKVCFYKKGRFRMHALSSQILICVCPYPIGLIFQQGFISNL